MTGMVQLERHKCGLDHPITIRFLLMLQEWDDITVFPGWYEKGVVVYVRAVYGDGQQQRLIKTGATNTLKSGQ